MASKSRSRRSSPRKSVPIGAVLFQVAIYLLFLGYILNLEAENACPCSATEERLFLKYWLMFLLGLTVIVYLMDQAKVSMPKMLASLLGLVMLVGSVYYLYCVLIFVREMRHTECNCSDTMIRSVMEVFALVSVLNIIASVLMMFWRAN